MKVWSVVALLFFLLLPTTINAHSQTQVVEMTPDGFKPDTFTIDQGSAVIFINKDRLPHWPASNTHPTHELYPEFDPKKEIVSGKSWAFKALEVGEWKFHDHLLPHQGGVIIVKPEANSIATQVKWWDKIKQIFEDLYKNLIKSFNKPQKIVLKAEDFTNLSGDKQLTALKNIADQNGATEAWDFIKLTYQGVNGSSGNIHDLAHLAGGLIYESKGFSGLGSCSSDFAFGCYHGFLDKVFIKNLDHLTDAKDACLKLGPENSGPVASCIHGIGHGVASFYLVKDLDKSLSTCRKLTSGSEFCFDGVFMEFFRSAPLSLFKSDDYLYPCDQLETKYGYAYSFACGRNQPTLLMSRFNKNLDDVIEVCSSAESKPFKQACFDSVGFTLASSGEPQNIIAGCLKIKESILLVRCIKSAAGELIFQEIPGWREKSTMVCNSYVNGREECLEYISVIIKEYNR